VAAVELRRPVQRHLRPDRLEAAAERGTPEAVVRRLQRLGVAACHQTIRSASARRPLTSYTPRTTTSPRPSSANSFSTSAPSAARSTSTRKSSLAQHVGKPDDRPHRVADRVVDLADRGGVGLRSRSWLHCAVHEVQPVTRTLQHVLDDLHDQLDDPGAAPAWLRRRAIEDEAVTGTLDGTRPWATATLTMTYSCAQAVRRADRADRGSRGSPGLDQPVPTSGPRTPPTASAGPRSGTCWPTRPGCRRSPRPAAEVDFADRDALVALLADAWPVHEPGTACAEHALTYGHLCDQLVRLATGEDLADRFAGIAAAHGWDLHLRVPPADLDRVADPVPVAPDWPRAYTEDPRWGPAMTRPSGLLDPARARLRAVADDVVPRHRPARERARAGDLLRTAHERLGQGAARRRVAPRVRRAAGHRPRPAARPRGDLDPRLPDRRGRHRHGRGPGAAAGGGRSSATTQRRTSPVGSARTTATRPVWSC
jgi:hypothetical protein